VLRGGVQNHLRNNRQYLPAVPVVGRFPPVALKHQRENGRLNE